MAQHKMLCNHYFEHCVTDLYQRIELEVKSSHKRPTLWGCSHHSRRLDRWLITMPYPQLIWYRYKRSFEDDTAQQAWSLNLLPKTSYFFDQTSSGPAISSWSEFTDSGDHDTTGYLCGVPLETWEKIILFLPSPSLLGFRCLSKTCKDIVESMPIYRAFKQWQYRIKALGLENRVDLFEAGPWVPEAAVVYRHFPGHLYLSTSFLTPRTT